MYLDMQAETVYAGFDDSDSAIAGTVINSKQGPNIPM